MASRSTRTPSPWTGLATLWISLVSPLFDGYRPELHYMRGPGPKWRAKHQVAQPGEPALERLAKATV